MSNLVETLHQICTDNNIEFSYSTKAGLNLLDNTTKDKIYFALLSPLKRVKGYGIYGSNGKHKWSATAFLLRQSYLENTIYNENEHTKDEGKYMLNISSLYAYSDLLENKLAGCDFEVTSWEDSETYDEFDANMDGLIIQFTYET